jgi:hypothetical protein
MSRVLIVLSLVFASVALSRCASTCDRNTASDGDVHAYKPAVGEVHRN